MKYALVNNSKTEAAPGLKGTCPSCGSELIAKCGKIKINHWAHKGTRNCDPWWENETEWHRSWKNNFPIEWQETLLIDSQTGERHIADVRTIHGLVIEFQHSHLDSQERITREKFYQNMVWVVDGTRLKKDYQKFLNGKGKLHPISKGHYFIDQLQERFPLEWTESTQPVIFDFKGNETIDDINDLRNHLYCLFPGRIGRFAVLAVIPRIFFVHASKNDQFSLWIRTYMAHINQVGKEQQDNEARLKQKKTSPSHRFAPYPRRRRLT